MALLSTNKKNKKSDLEEFVSVSLSPSLSPAPPPSLLSLFCFHSKDEERGGERRNRD